MIQPVWSVLCQSASFDMQNNTVSLFNTIENFIVFRAPSKEIPLILSCEIVSLWTRATESVPTSGQMQVYLMQGDKKAADAVISLEIDLKKTPFHRTRISIGALPLFSTGRFEFCVEYKLTGEHAWQHAARLPFYVIQQPMPQTPPMPGA
jgi:hypothetical protein